MSPLGIVDDDFVQRLGAFDGRAADLLLAAGRIGLETDLSEIGGRLIILVLRPALERMVVALVAIEAHAPGTGASCSPSSARTRGGS